MIKDWNWWCVKLILFLLLTVQSICSITWHNHEAASVQILEWRWIYEESIYASVMGKGNMEMGLNSFVLVCLEV